MEQAVSEFSSKWDDMALFIANPLSLSFPEPAFESWLRDNGYLEILDDHSTTIDSCPSPPPLPSSSSSSTPSSSTTAIATVGGRDAADKRGLRRLSASVFSTVRIVIAVLTLNPFAKLTSRDFSGDTPPWTTAFIAARDHPSYSWPAGPSQARMRLQENVKRYARNYTFLTLLILACSLYQMPKSLLGLVACLALWEGLWFCSDRWMMEECFPSLRNVLDYTTQMATAILLYYCNLQVAVVYTIGIGYSVMIIHASLRKLSPSKQSMGVNRLKRFHQTKYRS